MFLYVENIGILEIEDLKSKYQILNGFDLNYLNHYDLFQLASTSNRFRNLIEKYYQVRNYPIASISVF